MRRGKEDRGTKGRGVQGGPEEKEEAAGLRVGGWGSEGAGGWAYLALEDLLRPHEGGRMQHGH